MVKFDGALLTGMLLGLGFVTTGGAVAGFGIASGHAPRYADVVHVRPVTRTVSMPRQVCVQVSSSKRDAAEGVGAGRDGAKPSRERCRTVKRNVARVVAYDVSYRLGDTVGVVRLQQAPGARVLVEDGRVELEPATTPDGASVDVLASG